MTTIAEAALDYHTRRKWKPVPVNRRTKKPIGNGWQNHPFNPNQFNGNAQNVGIQFGALSGGLADVDLDSKAAIGLAPEFLPATDAVFGRKSKPCSHQLYVCDLYKTEKRAAIQYALHMPNGHGKIVRGQMIVELRIGGDGKGAQSVVPPSIHSGETVEWVNDGEPAKVAGEELAHAVCKLAVASLLSTHYPGQGSRHDGALVIGGVLARAGWDAKDIGHVVEVVARAAGDPEVSNRITAAASAVGMKSSGQNVAGLQRLRQFWGDEVADTLKYWLKGSGLRSDHGLELEDHVALDFAAKHVDDFRYVAKSGQWMRWQETRWQAEDTLFAFDQSRKLCRDAGDSRAKTVAAVITLARSDRRMAATEEQWDADREIFNALTTTVDLRARITRAPNRLDYCTKQAAVSPALPGTPCPMWMQFLDRVLAKDQPLIKFLQSYLGYCLTALVLEHVLVFLFGTGANGKTTFTETVADIFNDYAITAPMEMFLTTKYDRHPTEIARLKGARLVLAHETTKGRAWDEEKVKKLTGGGGLTGRFMRGDFFDFDPTHKLLIEGNSKPSLRNVDEAIRRRFVLVPFTVTIPEKDRDPKFKDTLKPEWPAILRWMIEGYVEWKQKGLIVPASVRKATDEYLAEQDTLGEWLTDYVKTDPNAFTLTRDLFASWRDWCDDRNLAAGTAIAFSENLKDRGYDKVHRVFGNGFNGIKL
jgi:P4 family phage/plasmid primase-like protien